MPRRKNLSIRVTIREKDGKYWLRFRDPLTGKEQLRPVQGKYRSEWLREAGAWERELQDDASLKQAQERAAKIAILNLSWKEFRIKFAEEHLTSLADKSDTSYTSALDIIERHFEFDSVPDPVKINDISEQVISRAAASLRRTGIAETTIDNYLRHLKAALNWAKGMKYLPEVPTFPRLQRARKGQKKKPMKGRPPTDAEVESMLACVGKVVHATEVKRISSLIRGLWLGGLRLGEALRLWWDSPSKMRVDLAGKFPVLIIPADTEKGGKDRIYPIAPEFAEFLLKVPKSQRKGKVFKVQLPGSVKYRPQQDGRSPTLDHVSKTLTRIGKAAKVATHKSSARGKGSLRDHYAGAHSLRRAFGTRWARRVLPQILQQMMRHESIETTLRYYVELESEVLAGDIYRAFEEFQQSVKSAENMKKTKTKTDQTPENSGGAIGGVVNFCPQCGFKIPHKNQEK